jgi:UDP-N-acetylmuramate: L-alanyl-gamma-D-glutamyl-meso-diaminopimelate ligase
MGEYAIENRHCIVVAGTHGKTTTTSHMAWLADQAQLKPGFLIGGIPKNFGLSFRSPKGNYFVIEGDEYDTAFFDKVPKFIHYRPRTVILTSVEFDHADIYKNLDDVKSAFARLLKLIPDDGLLVAQAEDKNIQDLLQKNPVKTVVTYGFKNGDYSIAGVERKPSGTSFDVLYKGKKLTRLTTGLFGDFNLLNVLATYVVSRELKFDLSLIEKAVTSFEGVKRRQEILGRPRNITVIEDFAHHPTAVELTIKTVQERFQGAKVISVFEPRSATSRRSIFQDDYAKAFSKAHSVIVAEPYDQSKIPENDRFSVAKLIWDIKAQGCDAYSFKDTDQIITKLVQLAKPGDAILVMSNGGFGGLYGKLLNALESGQ